MSTEDQSEMGATAFTRLHLFSFNFRKEDEAARNNFKRPRISGHVNDSFIESEESEEDD